MPTVPEPLATDQQIETALLELVTRRGSNSSACPSEVARQLNAQAWRTLMPQVRQVAARLALAGKINVTQRGVVLSPEHTWTGAIRLRLVPASLATLNVWTRPPA